MSILAKSNVKEVLISAVITRADGTKEDLGVVASKKKGFIELLKDKLKKI